MATFTTIAAATSLAISAGTTGASFAQASKQRKLQQKAEAEAERALADARKKLDVNYYENLGIQKEAYQLEREALLSVGSQAIQAGVESERGAAAVAGRVQMASQEGQRKVAAAMGQEMMALDKLVAAEDAAIAQKQANLDLAEAQGAQLAARDAQEAAAAATAQGFAGLKNIGQQVMQLTPLYGKDSKAQQAALGEMSFNQDQFNQFGNVASVGGIGSPIEGGSNLDFQAIKNMTGTDYNRFVKSLTPQQKAMLFQNKQYTDLYNSFNPF